MSIALNHISKLASGYWESQVLFALVEVGIPELLNERGVLTAEEIAAALNLKPIPTRSLLAAAVHLRVLKIDNDSRFSLSSSGGLLAGERSLAAWVRVMSRWYVPWGQLASMVRTGSSAEDRWQRLREDKDYVNDFIMGIDAFNSFSAHRLTVALKEGGFLKEDLRVVDLGCGAGTYAKSILAQVSTAYVTLVDVPDVLCIARENMHAEWLNRVDFVEGSYYTGDYPSEQALILMSNILHQESPDGVRTILGIARQHLSRGGHVVVNGMFLNEDGVSPGFTTLHNLSAQVLWDGGRSYTQGEVSAIANRVGLEAVEVLNFDKSVESALILRQGDS